MENMEALGNVFRREGLMTHQLIVNYILLICLICCVLFPVSVQGESPSPYGNTLFYPNYTMQNLRDDLTKLSINIPEKNNIQALAEAKTINYLCGQLSGKLSEYSDGNSTVELISSVLSEYIGKNGEYYAQEDSKARFDPMAKVIWEKVQNKLVTEALGEAVVSTFGVGQIATVPVQILESAWVAHISMLRNEDIKEALAWYVKKRYEYDYNRHRNLMLQGQRFKDIQYSARFPYDFSSSTASNPFSSYGIEPYYISISERTGAEKLLFGKWDTYLSGAPSPGGEVDGFYNVWANIMYAEGHEPDTELAREMNALSKDATQTYVRKIVKNHADSCLRDFMTAFEKYYYELYCSRYLYEIRRAVSIEALMISVLKYRDYQILERKFKKAEERAKAKEEYDRCVEENAQQLEDQEEADSQGDSLVEDGEEASEAAAVQQYIIAMTHASDLAKDCESGRVNYGNYKKYMETFGETSPNYLGLTYQSNRNTYMTKYNQLKGILQALWQENATEFASLLNEFETMGNIVFSSTGGAASSFDAVREYYRKIGNVPLDLAEGVSDFGLFLFNSLGSTNFSFTEEDNVGLVHPLPAEDLATLSNDVDLVTSRLQKLKTTLDMILDDYPSQEDILKLDEKFQRAILLREDLLTEATNMITHFASRSVTWGPRYDGAGFFYNRVFSDVEIDTSNNYDENYTDLINFTDDDYLRKYLANLGLLSNRQPWNRKDSIATNDFAFNPTEIFRNIMGLVYNEIDEGFEAATEVRKVQQTEYARREVTDELYWEQNDDIFDEPLPSTETLFSTEGCLSLSIAPSNIAVLGTLHHGLQILDISDPDAPTLLGTAITNLTVQNCIIEGDTVYAAADSIDLVVIDISTPTHPVVLAECDDPFINTNASSCDLAINGNYIYITAGAGGLRIYDKTLLTNSAVPVASILCPGASSIKIADPYAYVACQQDGVKVLDLSNPTSPVTLFHQATSPIAVDRLEHYNNLLLLSLGDYYGFTGLDCSCPTNLTPVFHGTVCVGERTCRVKHAIISDSRLLVTGSRDGETFGCFKIYRLENNLFPCPEKGYAIDGYGEHIAINDGYAWISCSKSSVVHSFEIETPEERQEFFSDSSYEFAPQVELQTKGSGRGDIVVTPGDYTTDTRRVVNIITGTVVTANAIPQPGSFFSGWEGSYTSTSSSIMFTVTNITSLVALFSGDSHSITSSCTSGGTITPSGVVHVAVGSPQTFIISTNVDAVISNVFVDGTAIGSVQEFQFIDVATSHCIHATFSTVDGSSCGVMSGAGPGGTVYPLGWNTYTPGSDASYTITPDPDYRIVNVCVDGTNYGPSITSFSYTNISVGIHTLNACFERDASLVTFDTSLGGKATPAVPLVFYPDTPPQSVQISANDGYYISSVYSNDTAIGSWDTSTTSAVYNVGWSGSDTVYKVTFSAILAGSENTPIWWMKAAGIITNDYANAALQDPDNDGMATWCEYVADTDPMIQTSCFQLLAFDHSVAGSNVLWNISCYGSDDRLYEIEGAMSLSPTSMWKSLSTPTVGNDDVMSWQINTNIHFLRMRTIHP